MRSFLIVFIIIGNVVYQICLQQMEWYVIVGKMTTAQYAFAYDTGLKMMAFAALIVLLGFIPTGERR